MIFVSAVRFLQADTLYTGTSPGYNLLKVVAVAPQSIFLMSTRRKYEAVRSVYFDKVSVTAVLAALPVSARSAS